MLIEIGYRLSGILSDLYFDILSRILCGVLSDIWRSLLRLGSAD